MESIGPDLHKRESQLAIKAADGTITDQRIANSRERFTAVFGAPPASCPVRDRTPPWGGQGRTDRRWGDRPLLEVSARSPV